MNPKTPNDKYVYIVYLLLLLYVVGTAAWVAIQEYLNL